MSTAGRTASGGTVVTGRSGADFGIGGAGMVGGGGSNANDGGANTTAGTAGSVAQYPAAGSSGAVAMGGTANAGRGPVGGVAWSGTAGRGPTDIAGSGAVGMAGFGASGGMLNVGGTPPSYYVSTLGNDANDGRTPNSAWASIDRVSNAFASGAIVEGDIIAFRAGDTFVGTLQTHGADGTAQRPITFTSYGTGPKPTFSGLVTLGNYWSNQGAGVWRYDVSKLPTKNIRYVLLGNAQQPMARTKVRYADTATEDSFSDADLVGDEGDFVAAEALMRTSAYTWDIRKVTAYTAASGRVGFAPATPYILGTDASVGGYFFQNSRRILERNATQGEWAHEGNYLYYFSNTDPFTLNGGLRVSSIDVSFDIEGSRYLVIDGLQFNYANHYCIRGGASDHKLIRGCDFVRCNVGIFEDGQSSSDSTIDSNTFRDIGSIAIQQYQPTNPTVTNNEITNVGLEIGRMPFVGDFGSNSDWYSAVVAYPNGGLFEYNNVRNVGNTGLHLATPSNHVVVRHNYVENPCILLVDGGAFYTWDIDETVTSDVNTITFSSNLAVISDYTNLDYLIGFENNEFGWIVEGFYKDGWQRATHWDNNFAYGFKIPLFTNPTKFSSWTNNASVAKYAKEYGSTALGVFDYPDQTPPQSCTDNTFTHNILVNALNDYPVAYLYAAQLTASANNTFDYNRMLTPAIPRTDEPIYQLDARNYLGLDEWTTQAAVGAHEQFDVFRLSQSGLSKIDDFVWVAMNPTKATVVVNLPLGYRYYTIDGDPVKADTLLPYQGKVYYRTIDEGMPQANNVKVGGTPRVGQNLTGSYDYTHEQGNTEMGTAYQWYRCRDNSVSSRRAIAGANSIDYAPTAVDLGAYLTLGVGPNSSDGPGKLVSGVERFSTPVGPVVQ